MKKSELRKIIREVINEQWGPSGEYQFLGEALAPTVLGPYGPKVWVPQGQEYESHYVNIMCPEGYHFENGQSWFGSSSLPYGDYYRISACVPDAEPELVDPLNPKGPKGNQAGKDKMKNWVSGQLQECKDNGFFNLPSDFQDTSCNGCDSDNAYQQASQNCKCCKFVDCIEFHQNQEASAICNMCEEDPTFGGAFPVGLESCNCC